jgi:hypothetical protein
MDIHRDELLGLLGSNGSNTAEELDHSFGFITLSVIEIQTVLRLLDIDCILVCAVLQNELLEVQECTFVGDLLAKLDGCAPGVVGETLLTIRALLCSDDVLNLEALLNDCTLESLLLNRKFDLHTTGVRLRPNETGVNNSDF